MRSNIFRQRSNYQDLIKVFALIAMVVDHVGLLFCPQISGLRIVGRFAMPIYCFFAGYNFKNKIYWRIAVAAILFQLFSYYVIFDAYVPMNILVPIFIGQLFLYFFGKYLTSFDVVFTQVVIFSLLYLVTKSWMESGTFVIALMLLGFFAKNHPGQRELAVGIMCCACFAMQSFSGYGVIFSLYDLFGVFLVDGIIYIVLARLPLNSSTSFKLNFISRNGLYLYLLQFVLLLLAARYWHSINGYLNLFF